METTVHLSAPRRRVPNRRLGALAWPLAAGLVTLGVWFLGTDERSRDTRTSAASRENSRRDAAASGAPDTGKNAGTIQLAVHEVPAGASLDQDDRVGEPADPDERHRRMVVGDWEDDYQGHRRLTVRDDGTAVMVVEPSGLGKRLFADRLTFDVEWSLHEGRIVMTTTGGEPKSKAQLVLKLYGNRAEYTLLNLDDRQLLLLDRDGKTRYDWRRIAAD
ncbi:MAG: hypothetical protein ACKV0T_18625 [Planctomycetales bacterium]